MAIVDPEVKHVSQGLNLLTLCWRPFPHSSSSVLEDLVQLLMAADFLSSLRPKNTSQTFNKDVKWAHLGGEFGSTNLLQGITYVFSEIVFYNCLYFIIYSCLCVCAPRKAGRGHQILWSASSRNCNLPDVGTEN